MGRRIYAADAVEYRMVLTNFSKAEHPLIWLPHVESLTRIYMTITSVCVIKNRLGLKLGSLSILL